MTERKSVLNPGCTTKSPGSFIDILRPVKISGVGPGICTFKGSPDDSIAQPKLRVIIEETNKMIRSIEGKIKVGGLVKLKELNSRKEITPTTSWKM